jgi:hypothetical protein
VRLSVGNDESALAESTGPTGKRSASKDARSVWKGGKTVKSYLSLPSYLWEFFAFYLTVFQEEILYVYNT